MEKPTTEDVGRALRDGPAAADDADAVAEANVEFEGVKGRGREGQNFWEKRVVVLQV